MRDRDDPRIRISVLQPPKSGIGGKSWHTIWTGHSSIRALLTIPVVLAARNGRSIRVDWRN